MVPEPWRVPVNTPFWSIVPTPPWTVQVSRSSREAVVKPL